MNQTQTIDSLMEQAQVFASAWSLVGSMFDKGQALDDAQNAKTELREMLIAVLAATHETKSVAVTDVQIDEILDSPGSMAYVVSDRRQRMHLFARRVLALAQPADAQLERLQALINSPELHNFLRGVHLEAVHQVERWGEAHDRQKRPADWFWLVGYLAGKALHAADSGNQDKALHHCISTAAALYNWHCAIKGQDVRQLPAGC